MNRSSNRRWALRAGGVAAAASVMVGSGLGASASASAAGAAKTSGAIQILVVNGSPKTDAQGSDVVTGVITDYGHDHGVGQTNFQKIVLSKGSFEVNASKLNKSFKVVTNAKKCTAVGSSFGANMPVLKGTGAYAGITGSLSLKAEFVAIGQTTNGKCSLTAQPKANNSFLQGSGNVSF